MRKENNQCEHLYLEKSSRMVMAIIKKAFELVLTLKMVIESDWDWDWERLIDLLVLFL